MTQPLTVTTIRLDVAEMLHRVPTDLRNDEDLFEAGMESMRLMTLIERWRAAGAEISFIDLAGNPTLANWLALLTDAR
jgi:aryl carrier-like protein